MSIECGYCERDLRAGCNCRRLAKLRDFAKQFAGETRVMLEASADEIEQISSRLELLERLEGLRRWKRAFPPYEGLEAEPFHPEDSTDDSELKLFRLLDEVRANT